MSVASVRDQGPASARVTGRALVPFIGVPPLPGKWSPLQVGLIVAAFGLALGLGGGGAYEARHWLRGSAWQTASSAAALHRLEDQVGRLQQSVEGLRTAADTPRSDDGLRGLKHSVDALKQDIDLERANSTASVAQLSARIEKVDHDPSPKLADIAARLDRIEKQATAQAAGAAAPPHVAVRPVPVPVSPLQAAAAEAPPPSRVVAVTPPAKPPASAAPLAKSFGAVPPARAGITQVAGTAPESALPDKPATVTGWALREVYDGVALVEGRDGGLREVGPGQYLPGAGQVRAIERRGRTWVVLTSRGVIANTTF